MRITVRLYDNERGEEVEAILFDEVTEAEFQRAEVEWRPMKQAAEEARIRSGNTAASLEHSHWDWASKAPRLLLQEFTCYALECEDKLQGLVAVDTTSQVCRLPEQLGKQLAYIDYIEAAPWNLKQEVEPLGMNLRFRGVGTRLVRAAVNLSEEKRFEGRLGLHSLPQSTGFYSRLGMTPVGEDMDYNGLVWFEFTLEGARRFLADRGGTP